MSHPIILNKLITDLLENKKVQSVLDFELDILASAVCGFGYAVVPEGMDREVRKKENIEMLKYTLDLVHGLSAVSNFDLYPFIKILRYTYNL